MSYQIEFDSRVASELKEIVSWYEKQSLSATAKFETAFELILETLSEGVIDFMPFTEEIKRASIPDFPYHIYYSRNEEVNKVFIHAILHSKREPGFIFKRLGE